MARFRLSKAAYNNTQRIPAGGIIITDLASRVQSTDALWLNPVLPDGAEVVGTSPGQQATGVDSING